MKIAWPAPPAISAARCRRALAASPGLANQAAGTAQELYWRAKDTAADAAQIVGRSAADAEDFVRRTIEERPYTTAFVALCIGWVIGRMGRRDRSARRGAPLSRSCSNVRARGRSGIDEAVPAPPLARKSSATKRHPSRSALLTWTERATLFSTLAVL